MAKMLAEDCKKKSRKLYYVWKDMKRRCNNYKDEHHYKNYGARGIMVCKEWEKSFSSFRDWAYKNGWSEDNTYPSGKNKLTIDRIDNDGNYTPENCRIITHYEQQYNKRTTVYIEYKGKKYTYKDISILFGIPKTTLVSRIKMGWSIEDAVEIPSKVENINIKEIRLKLFMTREDFAKNIGVSKYTVKKWERGLANPLLKSQKKIVDFCRKNGIEV